MAGTKLAAREKRAAERQDKAVARHQRMNESCNETVVLVSSNSSLDNGSNQTEAAPEGNEEKAHTETPAYNLHLSWIERRFQTVSSFCCHRNYQERWSQC